MHRPRRDFNRRYAYGVGLLLLLLVLEQMFRFFAAKCITELQRMQNTRFAGLCVPKLRQNNNETSKIDLFWDVVGGQGVGRAEWGATQGGQKWSELNFTLVKYPSEAGFSCLKMEAISRFDGYQCPFKFVFHKNKKKYRGKQVKKTVATTRIWIGTSWTKKGRGQW